MAVFWLVDCAFPGEALREEADLDAFVDDVLAVVEEIAGGALLLWSRPDVARRRGGRPDETHG